MDGKPRETELYVKRQIPHPFVIPKRSEESAFAGSIPAASNSRFLNGYRRFGMTKTAD
jgi:hypothetical protein